jgi:predicted nuclease of restriction endonuclease-like (RecB) superfamily
MSKDTLNFNSLVSLVEQTHLHFQQQAVKAVNVSLTIRNWLVGYYIVEFEQKGEDRAEYGSKLLSKLAESSKHIKGFDERSFRNFRLFYKQYPHIQSYVVSHFPKLSIWGSSTAELDLGAESDGMAIRGSLTTESDSTTILVPADKILNNLSYTHLEQLFSIEDPLKRVFYEMECIKGTWSVRELKRQINSLYFERLGMSKKPELLSQLTQQEIVPRSPNEIVKSVYAFEFLGLNAKDAVEESDLETALLDQLQHFMLEMGHGFCLEARQKKILIGDEYFFVDLVFYHRILKCHVLVELKVEDFNHHNVGQLNTYVNYYKAEVMQPDDNPTVGILLVTQKNNALVEYATAGMDNQLFVSKYLLELPKKEELAAFIQKEIATRK